MLLAATGGGALLAISVGVAVWPAAGTPGPSVQAVVAAPGDRATTSDAAPDALQLVAAREAREQAQASRDRTRPTVPPTATSSATVQEPATPQPAELSPSVAPTPTPSVVEPDPVPAVVGQLWVTTDVNVRLGPAADLELIGQLAALTQVDVTGVTESGWTQTVTGGRTGWVNSSYLSKSKPEPQPEPESAVVSDASCSISPSTESNLTANARAVYRAVCAAYGGSVSAFGGYRPGDDRDHGSGQAVDIMVTGEPGLEIARYVQAHAAEFNVTYVIYQQRIWQAGNAASRWELMADRGSVTANHYDHVHVSVS